MKNYSPTVRASGTVTCIGAVLKDLSCVEVYSVWRGNVDILGKVLRRAAGQLQVSLYIVHLEVRRSARFLVLQQLQWQLPKNTGNINS